MGVKGTAEHRSDRESATARLLAAYRTNGDTRARDRLVQLYLPLVDALAHRHARSGEEHDDLVQAGSIGLLNAIERFDPARGGEFAAFAVPTIAGEMKRHLRDRSAPVRLPRRLHEARTRLPSERQALTARLGHEPSPAELAKALGISAKDLARIASAGSAFAGEPVAAGGAEELEATPDRLLLSGAFQALDELDRRIVYMRFVEERSRRETAAELGISEAALARRTDKALAGLRNELEGRGFEDAAPATAAARKPSAGPAEPAEPADPAEPAKRQHRHSGRLLLRMPQSLHAELADAAEREDVSLNQFITNALAAQVGWHGEDGEAPARGGSRPSSSPTPPRWLPAALVTNIVVVVIAGAVALVLLVVALQQGL